MQIVSTTTKLGTLKSRRIQFEPRKQQTKNDKLARAGGWSEADTYDDDDRIEIKTRKQYQDMCTN